MTEIETKVLNLCELYGIDPSKEKEVHNTGLNHYVTGRRDTKEAQYWMAYDIQQRLGSVAIEPLAE